MSEDTTTTTDQETVQPPMEQAENLDTQAVQAEEVSETSEADTTTNTNDSSDELLEWAEKKGIKTDDPKVLLKMVRESEQKMHEATKQANALKNSVKSVSEDAGLDDVSTTLNRLAVTDFYLNNPGAKELDNEMAEIVTAKPYLANDLDIVYEIAKSRQVANNSVAERQAGKKEALAQVAKAENAQAPSTSASTRQTWKGYSEDDIAKMTLSEYEAFKQETGYDPFAYN
jgi:hypothetical protein